VPALIGALSDPIGRVRARAAAALGWIGTAARPAIKPLARLLTDADAEARRAALQSLRTLDPAGLPKALLSVFKTQARGSVRLMALEELARLDTTDTAVVQAFVGALDDPDQQIHRAALAGVNRASPEQALAYLCLGLRSARPEERVAAILNL